MFNRRLAMYAAASQGSGGVHTDTDALAWKAAVVTNSGTVSDGRLALMSTTIGALKSDGIWNSIDDMGALAAEESVSALTSWKQRRLGTAVASPTITADRSFAFNGSTQYVNTGFNPASHAVAMTGSDQMLGIYEVTNVNVNAVSAGLASGSTAGMSIIARNGTIMTVRANFTSTGFTTTPASDGRGLSCVYRTAAPVYGGTKNGASVGTTTPAGNTTALVSLELYIGALNNAGSPSTFRGSSAGYWVVGASAVALSATFYSILQTHMTAIGANV